VDDFVGDRAGTPRAGSEQNGAYDYPEPIAGGWPVRYTLIDENGNPAASSPTTTLEELDPHGGRYVEVVHGRYRIELLAP
jgi:hypothetical protein